MNKGSVSFGNLCHDVVSKKKARLWLKHGRDEEPGGTRGRGLHPPGGHPSSPSLKLLHVVPGRVLVLVVALLSQHLALHGHVCHFFTIFLGLLEKYPFGDEVFFCSKCLFTSPLF